jgi:DNA-binding response OmpR family regulator
MEEILKGKRILIVDDEPDILETLVEILDMCFIDSAPNFETAKKFLDRNQYDLAILDIMGVNGYELLRLTNEKGIPALMLTAHAVNPENLVKSITGGARSYVPKDKISEIDIYVADVLRTVQGDSDKPMAWFGKLEPFFDRKFGKGWKEKHKEFWKDFDKKYRPSQDELKNIM